MPRGRVTRPRLRQCSARGEPSGSVFRDRTPDPVVLDSDPNPLPKHSHVPGRFPPNPAHPKAGDRVPSPEVRLPADCLEPHPSYVISQQIRGPQPPNPLGSPPQVWDCPLVPFPQTPKLPQAETRSECSLFP